MKFINVVGALAIAFVATAYVTGPEMDKPSTPNTPVVAEAPIDRDAKIAHGELFFTEQYQKDCSSWNGVLITNKSDMKQKTTDCRRYKKSAQRNLDLVDAGMKKYGAEDWINAYSNQYK